MRQLMTACAALLLAACVAAPERPQLPALQLSPAAFGASVSLAQRLTVTRADAAAQTLDAQLEIEPAGLRLAGFALNQRVLTLSWDGARLQTSRHPLLPAVVDAQRVLRDVQLVYWPAAAISAVLPEGWALVEQGTQRQLLQQGLLRVQIDYAGLPRWQGRAELDNRLEGYRLLIESQPTMTTTEAR